MIDESHPENYQMLEWLVPLSIFLLLPTFSYYSILLSDHWYFSRKKVRAVAMRNSKDCRRLLKIRKDLQSKVRRFVEVHLRENTFAGAYAKGGLKSGDRELSREDDRMQTLTEEEGTNSESGGEGSRKVYPERVKVEGVA